MMLETFLLAWALVDGLWYLLSVVVFFSTLFLIALILLQDSKDTGLTSAFGGGSNTSLMGARMQKDLAKLTAVLAVILGVSLFTMGVITAKTSERTLGATDGVIPPPNTPEAPPMADPGNPLGGSFPGIPGLPGGITPLPGGSNPTLVPSGGGTAPGTPLAPAGTPPTPPAGTPPGSAPTGAGPAPAPGGAPAPPAGGTNPAPTPPAPPAPGK